MTDKPPPSDKDRRLKTALRDNLKRRKAAARRSQTAPKNRAPE